MIVGLPGKVLYNIANIPEAPIHQVIPQETANYPEKEKPDEILLEDTPMLNNQFQGRGSLMHQERGTRLVRKRLCEDDSNKRRHDNNMCDCRWLTYPQDFRCYLRKLLIPDNPGSPVLKRSVLFIRKEVIASLFYKVKRDIFDKVVQSRELRLLF